MKNPEFKKKLETYFGSNVAHYEEDQVLIGKTYPAVIDSSSFGTESGRNLNNIKKFIKELNISDDDIEVLTQDGMNELDGPCRYSNNEDILQICFLNSASLNKFKEAINTKISQTIETKKTETLSEVSNSAITSFFSPVSVSPKPKKEDFSELEQILEKLVNERPNTKKTINGGLEFEFKKKLDVNAVGEKFRDYKINGVVVFSTSITVFENSIKEFKEKLTSLSERVRFT